MIPSRVARNAMLVAHTVRWLRPRQVAYRLLRRFVRPRPDLRPAPGTRRVVVRRRPAFLPRESTLLGSNRFRLLNHEEVVPPHAFASRKGTLLWDYNFHYFDGLFGVEPDDDAKAEWIDTWIQHVTPGSRPGWDPYPVSRRLMNWMKWALATGRSSPAFLDSMAAQVRYLDRQFEYHLLANHLLVNAVALTAAGAFFEGEEADAWHRKGERVLASEMEEQFLADGGHFELSPVYHAGLLEDLLDLIQLLEAVGRPVPRLLRDTASGATQWLALMTRPDGRVPLLNDAAYGVAPEPARLADYAERLGIAAEWGERRPLDVLEPSGYFRYEGDRLFVIGDIGPPGPSYQPGHVHCDMLSFELCWDGRPVLVDTGTSTYEQGTRRTFERGTSAHNTVQIGSREQSEIWAAFRVARRARVLDRAWSDTRVGATVRAFPTAWTIHERSWRFDGEAVTVEDRVRKDRGNSETCTARFHFHPSVTVSGGESAWQAGGIEITLEGAVSTRIEHYEYAPEFNLRREGLVLAVSFEDRLVTRVRAA